MDGRKIRTLFKIDGNNLICEQRDRKTKELQVTSTRSVNEAGKMVEVTK